MPYDNTIPSASHTPAQDQGPMMSNFYQIGQSYNQDHVPLNSGTNVGLHTQVSLAAPATASPAGSVSVFHSTNGMGTIFNGIPIPFFANSTGDYPMIPDLQGAPEKGSFKIGPLIVNYGSYSGYTPGSLSFLTTFTTVIGCWLQNEQVNAGQGTSFSYIGINGLTTSGVSFVIANSPALVYVIAIGY